MTQPTERKISTHDGFQVGPAQNRSDSLSTYEQTLHAGLFKLFNASEVLQQAIIDKINDPQEAENLSLRQRLLEIVGEGSDTDLPFELTYDKSSAVFSVTQSGQTVFAIGIDTQIANPPLVIFARQEDGQLLIKTQNCSKNTFLPFVRNSITAPRKKFNQQPRELNGYVISRFQPLFETAS